MKKSNKIKVPAQVEGPILQQLIDHLSTQPITLNQAKTILLVVDKGLSDGLGVPKPGQMCVEAAVCYALGLPHNDEPPCVDMQVGEHKIGVNDLRWSTKKERAKGLRKLSIAQLGTNKPGFDYNKFESYLVLNGAKYLYAVQLKHSLQYEYLTKEEYEAAMKQLKKAKTATEASKAAFCNRDIDEIGDLEKVLCEIEGQPKERDAIYAGYAEIFVEALGKGKSEGYKLMKQLIK